MKLSKGQKVKCLFDNNLTIEGVVEDFNNNELVLTCADSRNLCIIPNVKQNILCIKVFTDQENPLILKQELENEFSEIRQQDLDEDLKIRKLAELKKMLNLQEKKIIRDKLVDHSIGERKPVNYESQFRFFKK